MASKSEKKKREIRIAGAREAAERSERVFESTSLNIPKGMKSFKFEKAKTYRLDFLPYLAGQGNPGADEGFMYFTRKYYTHSIPTIDGQRPYCCLKQTFGRKKCPICDEIAALRRSGKTWDETKSLQPKERDLFQVYDLDVGREEILLFEFNHWQFGRLLDLYLAKRLKFDQFFHFGKPGYTIEIDVEEDSYEGKPTFKPTGAFTFQSREEEYSEDILDQTKCLDDIPKELSYDALRAIFLQLDEEGNPPAKTTPGRNGASREVGLNQGVVEEDSEEEDSELEEPEEEPKNKAGKKMVTAKSKGITTDSTVKHSKHGVCKVVNVSMDGTTCKLELKGGKKEMGILVSELDLVKEESKAKADRPAAKAPVDDEEEDSEDDSDLESDDEDEDEDSEDSDLDDSDDDSDDEDSEEDGSDLEDEPVVKKKPGKK